MTGLFVSESVSNEAWERMCVGLICGELTVVFIVMLILSPTDLFLGCDFLN